jgi:hypothetical protein
VEGYESYLTPYKHCQPLPVQVLDRAERLQNTPEFSSYLRLRELVCAPPGLSRVHLDKGRRKDHARCVHVHVQSSTNAMWLSLPSQTRRNVCVILLSRQDWQHFRTDPQPQPPTLVFPPYTDSMSATRPSLPRIVFTLPMVYMEHFPCFQMTVSYINSCGCISAHGWCVHTFYCPAYSLSGCK